MGRPKKGDKKPPSPQSDADERVAIIHLKGSLQYAAFLDDIYRKTHIPKASIFRLAFAQWCKTNGHGEPPDL